VRSVSRKSNVWTLISSAPLSTAALLHTQRRVPIYSLNVASQSAISASCDLVVPACQIWCTFGKINKGQWTVMHRMVNYIRSRQQESNSPVIILQGPPGTGKIFTVAKLLSTLYHAMPTYQAPGRNTRQRTPSMRTLICTSHNAGLDEILNRFVKEGVSTVTFEHVKGAPHAQDFVSITDLFETIHKQAANGEVDCASPTGSRSIRAPQWHVASLDDE
jgi:Cdc6-like AAA superfamily ATPase